MPELNVKLPAERGEAAVNQNAVSHKDALSSAADLLDINFY